LLDPFAVRVTGVVAAIWSSEGNGERDSDHGRNRK